MLFCRGLQVRGAVQSVGMFRSQSFLQTWVPLIMLQMKPGAHSVPEAHETPSSFTRVGAWQSQSGLSCPPGVLDRKHSKPAGHPLVASPRGSQAKLHVL